jgi:DNA-binding NtrC family response regulator
VRRALRNTEPSAPAPFSLATLGRSPALVEARKRLAQLAHQSGALLLRGEPGASPELFVRLLAAPGTTVLNGTEALAGDANDLLQRATGGILFVPDLARLGRSEQRNLAFVVERAKKHRVRVVSFSAIDAAQLSEQHEFDAELVRELAQLSIRLPALRSCAEDVPDLAAAMLTQRVESRACPPRRLSVAAQNALRHHIWSGGFEELAAVVRDLSATALDEEIGPDDVQRVLETRGPAAPGNGLALDRPYREVREEFERMYFGHLLAREGGSMSRVAERSGLERTHLYRKLKALGLPVGRREEA